MSPSIASVNPDQAAIEADTMALMVAIGGRLRKYRRQHALSQTDLALQAGLEPRHICLIERGRLASIRLTTLVKLARAMHSSVSLSL